MEKKPNVISSDWWKTYLGHLGKPDPRLLEYSPDFMIISPPRTGSTWLSSNLGHHPEIFMPIQKEIRFFSTFWKSYDINCYLNHFRDTSKAIKGEASPSYALLPAQIIKMIYSLMPRLKLIFIMRNPVERAWSHAKHLLKYRVINFGDLDNNISCISERKWQEIMLHDYNLACGDYVNSLRRWLAFFPKEQFYLGFYDSLKDSPANLMAEIAKFLKVKKIDWTQLPLTEKVNIGQSMKMPENLERCMEKMCSGRVWETECFLKKEFNLATPNGWQMPLKQNNGDLKGIDYREKDDEKRLTEMLFSLESDFIMKQEPSIPLKIESRRNFDIFFYRHKFYAFDQSLGALDILNLTENDMTFYEGQFKCAIANTLFDLKNQVDTMLKESIAHESDDR